MMSTFTPSTTQRQRGAPSLPSTVNPAFVSASTNSAGYADRASSSRQYASG